MPLTAKEIQICVKLKMNPNDQLKSFFKEKGIPSLNAEKFKYENHQMDNRIILHIEDVLNGNKYEDIVKIVGYTEHPSYKEDKGFGLMFETEDGEEFWCHY